MGKFGKSLMVHWHQKNPLTKTGKKVLRSMRAQYGDRAEEVFYKSINKKKPGSEKWHR